MQQNPLNLLFSGDQPIGLKQKIAAEMSGEQSDQQMDLSFVQLTPP
jgi:hypothetical protein